METFSIPRFREAGRMEDKGRVRVVFIEIQKRRRAV